MLSQSPWTSLWADIPVLVNLNYANGNQNTGSVTPENRSAGYVFGIDGAD